MKAVVQRVAAASVAVEDEVIGSIGQGLAILLGVVEGDTEREADFLANKITQLRIFTDSQDKMNLSVEDMGGEMLVVSQFTLYGDCRRGKRPSFTRAARPETAIPLYESFVQHCRATGLPVETGEFGADMQVELINDGPVTIWMDTDEMKKGAKV